MPSHEPVDAPDPAHSGKGRPTPKRRHVEAAQQRPLVPTDRKAARQTARAASRAARDREYQAMQTGDERFMPPRDKGPVRRWVRDYVDSRRSPGEYFLPISIGLVMATILFAQNPAASLLVLIVLYTVIFAVVIDALLLGRRMKKLLIAKFGEDRVVKGTLTYGVMRSFQLRKTRLPKPQVQRGERPT